MIERIAVIGLGYVGLPVALAFAKMHLGTIGFDIKQQQVKELSYGIDRTGESSIKKLMASSITLTGGVLQPGAVVVYESTVYPGVTEQIYGPILAQMPGLRQGKDFKLGCSPSVSTLEIKNIHWRRL